MGKCEETRTEHGLVAGEPALIQTGLPIGKSIPGYLFIFILIALCLISYCRTFDVPFLYDDFSYIENNPFIRNFGNYFNRQATLETYAANPGDLEDTLNNFITRPIAYFTFSLDYYFHGFSVAGYHLVNILIHTINVILVYLIVKATIRLLYEKHAQGAPEKASLNTSNIAFLTAALFAVHPLMANAVTYITQRMTSLVALFYLASILMYACYSTCHSNAKKVVIYCACIIFCCAAMLTKENAFTLPLMLALYEAAFCKGELRHRINRIAPLLLTLAIIPYNVIGLHNSTAPKIGGVVETSLNVINFSHFSSWEYLLTQFRAIAFYIKLIFIPLGLSLEHDFKVSHSIIDADVLLSLLLHLSLVSYGCYILCSSCRNKKQNMTGKLAGFGILWFYIALLVESSVIPLNVVAAEQRTYLPIFGFFLFAVCMVHGLFEKHLTKRDGLRADLLFWIPVICILVCLTFMRNEEFRKPDELWKQAISLYPKLARPYANLADYYISRGALADAIQVYVVSIQEMPNEAVLHYELGNVYVLAKNYESGIVELFQAVIMKPDMKKAYVRLAEAYVYSGRYAQAQETLDTANRLSPGRPQSRLPEKVTN